MARCLVTGHMGYIGSKVYKALQILRHEVLGIDLKEDNDILEALKPKANGEFDKYWSDFKPEYIFHLAAMPKVVYSIEHPIEVIENNVLSSLYVLEFARAVGAKRVIYSSSSSVVGNGEGPENPYGASKLMPESMCEVWSRLYGLDTICLRYFNVYSPDQIAEGPYATAVANWMQHIRDNKNPFITGNGEQRRDMVHVDDIVSANIFSMDYTGKFDGQHFDIGTGKNASLNEMKEIIIEHFPDIDFDYIDEREGEVEYTKANIQPLKELGWDSRRDYKEGTHECFRRLKNETI